MRIFFYMNVFMYNAFLKQTISAERRDQVSATLSTLGRSELFCEYIHRSRGLCSQEFGQNLRRILIHYIRIPWRDVLIIRGAVQKLHS